MNMFQQKEYVVEVTENDKSVEWNKVRNDLKKEYLKRNSKRTKIKIIDDVDDSEIDRIKKRRYRFRGSDYSVCEKKLLDR